MRSRRRGFSPFVEPDQESRKNPSQRIRKRVTVIYRTPRDETLVKFVRDPIQDDRGNRNNKPSPVERRGFDLRLEGAIDE